MNKDAFWTNLVSEVFDEILLFYYILSFIQTKENIYYEIDYLYLYCQDYDKKINLI